MYRLIITIHLLGIIGYGCKKESKGNSEVKRVPAAGIEQLRNFDITEPVSYDQLKTMTKHEIEDPWSDTYWPYVYIGMASRWEPARTAGGSGIPSVSWQFKSFIEAMKSSDPTTRLTLSPAEKYDYLLLGDSDSSIAKLDELGTENRFKSKIKDLKEAKNFAFDFSNDESISGLDSDPEIAKILNDLATLEATIVTGGQNAMQFAVELKNYINSNAYFRKNFPLFAEAWHQWAFYYGSPVWGSDTNKWSWMGHCHGWAGAALMAPKPVHGVLAKYKGKEVLFSPGDIRGLLTKVWANQPPEEVALGTTCPIETKYIDDPSSALNGRAFDAYLTENPAPGVPGEAQEVYVKIISKYALNHKDGSIFQGITFVREDSIDRIRYGLIVMPVNFSGGGPFTVLGYGEDLSAVATTRIVEFANYDDIATVIYNNKVLNPDADELKDYLSIDLHSGCYDANPMVLTLAMAHTFREKGKKLVIDRDFFDQVWNQPVKSYEMKMGDLRSINTLSNIDKAILAPGTTHVAEVSMDITYAVEPSRPSPTYQSELIDSMKVNYSLEFNANKELIGGEWNPIRSQTQDARLTARLRKFKPDYIAYFPSDKVKEVEAIRNNLPKTSLFDARHLEKIHACSLDISLPLETIAHPYLNSGGQPATPAAVKYAICEIEF